MENGMGDKHEMHMKWKQMKAVRVLTAVIVLIFVFWCGFQFGEIKAEIGSFHRGNMMFQTGDWGGGGMMRGGLEQGAAAGVAVPAGPTVQ